MASVFNPPPGRRRLRELLEEPQEPPAMSWPGLSVCRRLQRISIGFIKRRGGILRGVLTKFVCGKALSRKRNTKKSGRFVVSDCNFLEMENISKAPKVEAVLLPDSGGIGARRFDGQHQWQCMEMEDSKQLSPVSVLELHSDHSTSTLGSMESDLSDTRREWSHFQDHRMREIGIEIEAAIFEDIIEEAILNMIGFCCVCT